MIDYTNLTEKADKEGIEKYVVGIIVPKNDSILLLQRKSYDFLPDIYEFPGGGVDTNETLEQAAKRELEEETGFTLKEIKKYIGYFDYKGESGELQRIFHFVVAVEGYPKVIHPEHQAYAWVNKNEITKFPISSETLQIINNYFLYSIL